MPSANTTVMDMTRGLKNLDTSKVEVGDDDEQAVPSVQCGSVEEIALAKELDAALSENGVMDRWTSFKATSKYKELPLMCLRGRKYDVARAAELLPRLLNMIEELDIESTEGHQLVEDAKTHKVLPTGTADAHGRALIWIRLPFHDPKVIKARDMARLLATTMLHVLMHDSEAQRTGVAVINDLNGVGLKNLDPGAAKMIFGTVLANLPIRVGRIIIINPPWVVGHILLPIVLALMKPKLRARITIVNGSQPEPIFAYVPQASLPSEIGGAAIVDADQIVVRILK